MISRHVLMLSTAVALTVITAGPASSQSSQSAPPPGTATSRF